MGSITVGGKESLMITCSECIKNKLENLPCSAACKKHWKESNERLRKRQEDIILNYFGSIPRKESNGWRTQSKEKS